MNAKDSIGQPIGPWMMGRHVWKKLDLNDENSQIQYTRSVQSHSRRAKLIQNCKRMCLFYMDGQITVITWHHRMITGPFVMEVSLQEDSDFDEKDDNHASLQHLIQCSSLLETKKRTKKSSLNIAMETNAQCSMLV